MDVNRNSGWCQKSPEWRHPNFVLGRANSLSPRYNSLRGFRSRGKRIRSSQNKIRGDVTQGISDVTPNSGSHPSAAPPSTAQDVIVDYIKYVKINAKKKIDWIIRRTYILNNEVLSIYSLVNSDVNLIFLFNQNKLLW